MLYFIMLIVAGSALTYISKFNLELVTVNLGLYTVDNVPLFYVMIGSLLSGLVLSYLIQLLRNVVTYFEIRAKSIQIKTDQEEILDLTKTVHQLELANEKLKHTAPEIGDPNAL